MKLLASSFLNFMQHISPNFAINRLKCAEWIFQQNPMLLEAFTLLFRFILSRLGTESAEDYRKVVNV
jgi:hypothetical protein